ncbi:hypothetical protein NDU88_004636 [Pleurodeles waltl]|uniref:Uncharacterized protein n=1 Tax=Pleurodeles waltl TaxID=8319 RepID=A0AAV7M819_PLEWA|nr:hypothetical protein NDU88_004636 [Pleurodeles waltl]
MGVSTALPGASSMWAARERRMGQEEALCRCPMRVPKRSVVQRLELWCPRRPKMAAAGEEEPAHPVLQLDEAGEVATPLPRQGWCAGQVQENATVECVAGGGAVEVRGAISLARMATWMEIESASLVLLMPLVHELLLPGVR